MKQNDSFVPPIVLGVTGPIGAGKSSAVKILAKQLEFDAIDLDHLAHEVLSFPEVIASLVSAFGRGILDEEGRIVRAELAKIAFQNEKSTAVLNMLTRPAIITLAKGRILSVKKRGVILEAAELFKSDLCDLCDETLSVLADQKTRLARLTSKDRGMSKDDALARMKLQWSDDEYAQQATHVIYNNGGFFFLQRTLIKYAKNLKRNLLH